MDPNITLAKLRELTLAVTQREDLGYEHFPTSTEREFAEYFNALDNWISIGGFLPLDWQSKPI